MVGAGLFQPLLCKDKGSLVNIQRTFINLTNFISLRLGSIADNHYNFIPPKVLLIPKQHFFFFIYSNYRVLKLVLVVVLKIVLLKLILVLKIVLLEILLKIIKIIVDNIL